MQSYVHIVLGRSVRARRHVTAAAAVNGERNHYATLGVSRDASTSDIRRAYRLLALKHHPDVNKEVGADEVFKSIRIAYDVLVKEAKRYEYDKTLHQGSVRRPSSNEWAVEVELENGLRFYKWSYCKRKMWSGKFWEQYNNGKEQFSFYSEADELSEKENTDEERGPFVEVLKSALVSLFLIQILGTQFSLTFNSIVALIDHKLDAGYKLGYLFAWILGGRGGFCLTLFLSLASWAYGKSSSSAVALVIVALWFGSTLARYAPLPPGALLTLLYMSIKLQVDLN